MVKSGSLFDSFIPHGMCYQWRGDILWLNVISDVTTAFAYFLIPAALLYYLHKKFIVTNKLLAGMLCLFIASCGITHLAGVWTIWSGQYGVHGLFKAITATASIVTVVLLFPAIPRLLLLRTATELELANTELQMQIEQRRQSEQLSLKLQEELARFNRITTVGQMATGLAHEVNQPLLAISASTDTAMIIAKNLPVAEPLLFECLDDVQKETQRAGEIIRTLRQFVSKKIISREQVDISKLVKQAVLLVRSDAKNAGVELVVKTQTIPTLNANSVQILQVLVNLLRNAVEAIAETKCRRSAGPIDRVTIEFAYDGSEVVVSVKDTGPGISDSIDPFAVFESHKSDGMGVGLSISRDIVEAHGGKLQYHCDKPHGANFTFNLPLVPE